MNADFKEINPEPANRLKQLMEENMNDKGRPLKASDLHRMTGISQKHLSNIITLNKTLTEGTALKIIQAFPDKKYRVPWLLGYDKFKTENEFMDSVVSDLDKSAERQDRLKEAFNTLAGDSIQLHKGSHTVTMNGEDFDIMDYYRLMYKTMDIIQLEIKYMIQARQGIAQSENAPLRVRRDSFLSDGGEMLK